MRPTYAKAWPHPLRLYRPATPSQRHEGMFSFAPCLPTELARSGFARPTVALDGVITPGLMMGAKKTLGLSEDDVVVSWSSIVAQVLGQDLVLDTHFDMPERRDSRGTGPNSSPMRTFPNTLSSASGGNHQRTASSSRVRRRWWRSVMSAMLASQCSG